jgi:hypothetical protein
MELGDIKRDEVVDHRNVAVKSYVSEPLNPQRIQLPSPLLFFSLINTHHFKNYTMFLISRCLSWLADANDFNLCQFWHLRVDLPSWT